MEWVKLSTRYYTDAAVLAAGHVAEVLFLRSLAYCGDQEKGGFVPSAALPLLTVGLPAGSARRAPAQLVEAGLWEVVDGGWRVTGWDHNQTDLETLSARRRATRERVAKHREQKKTGNGGRNAVTNAVRNADVRTPEVEEEEEVETAAAAARVTPLTDRPLPPAVDILRDALDARRMVVRWDTLTDAELAEIIVLIEVHGDGPLIASAVRAYRPDSPAVFARAWLPGWRALPAPGRALTVVTTPCDQPGHSGTTRHCAQCASERLAGEA